MCRCSKGKLVSFEEVGPCRVISIPDVKSAHIVEAVISTLPVGRAWLSGACCTFGDSVLISASTAINGSTCLPSRNDERR